MVKKSSCLLFIVNTICIMQLLVYLGASAYSGPMSDASRKECHDMVAFYTTALVFTNASVLIYRSMKGSMTRINAISHVDAKGKGRRTSPQTLKLLKWASIACFALSAILLIAAYELSDHPKETTLQTIQQNNEMPIAEEKEEVQEEEPVDIDEELRRRIGVCVDNEWIKMEGEELVSYDVHGQNVEVVYDVSRSTGYAKAMADDRPSYEALKLGHRTALRIARAIHPYGWDFYHLTIRIEPIGYCTLTTKDHQHVWNSNGGYDTIETININRNWTSYD